MGRAAESTLARRGGGFYFRAMNLFQRGWWMAGVIALSHYAGWSQDQVPAADLILIRQELEERFKRLESAVESLQASQERLQKRLAAVVEEVHRLQEEIAHKPNDAVNRDELRSLERKIVELNEKREADKRLILEQLDKLASAPPVIPPSPPPKPLKSAVSPDQPGYEYVVESGDTVSTIVNDFNAEFKKKGIKGRLTVSQVMKANQIRDESKLRVGQKLFIPEPTSAKP
jgi:Rad3-related DNA helicase